MKAAKSDSNTLYSVYALTNETGAIQEGYRYDAYGRQTVITGAGTDGIWFTNDDVYTVGGNSAVNNPYMYTGQRFDAETGNMYYKRRYYSSGFGRFLSRDPIGGFENRRVEINLYEYVESQPISYVDALGLLKCCTRGMWYWQVAGFRSLKQCEDYDYNTFMTVAGIGAGDLAAGLAWKGLGGSMAAGSFGRCSIVSGCGVIGGAIVTDIKWKEQCSRWICLNSVPPIWIRTSICWIPWLKQVCPPGSHPEDSISGF
jgi:RHS repeat-associated protein